MNESCWLLTSANESFLIAASREDVLDAYENAWKNEDPVITLPSLADPEGEEITFVLAHIVAVR